MEYDDAGPMSLQEWEDALLALVQEGLIVVSPRAKDGQPTFFPIESATEEMREFTKTWLEFPHFQIED